MKYHHGIKKITVTSGIPSAPAIPQKVSRPPGVPAPAPIQAPPTEPTLLATTVSKSLELVEKHKYLENIPFN